MSRWLIAAPAWGARYVDVFCNAGLPALQDAAASLDGGHDLKLIVHTDAPERIRAAAAGGPFPVEARPVPRGVRWDDILSTAHRDVLRAAGRRDRVMLLTADMVVSSDAFAACEARFNGGKRLICCSGMRALDHKAPRRGLAGRDLMTWAWRNRHPMTRACTWPDGNSRDLSRMYFEHDGDVVCRLALPHPLALVVDGRTLRFSPTIDVNLVRNFATAEVHVVTDPDELAVIELSPPDKEFARGAAMRDRFARREFKKITDRMYRFLLRHPIVICGKAGRCDDEAVVGGMLA